MKMYMKLSTVLLAAVLFASGCATLRISSGEGPEPINWREYNDC